MSHDHKELRDSIESLRKETKGDLGELKIDSVSLKENMATVITKLDFFEQSHSAFDERINHINTQSLTMGEEVTKITNCMNLVKNVGCKVAIWFGCISGVFLTSYVGFKASTWWA